MALTKEILSLERPYRNIDDTTPTTAIYQAYNMVLTVTDKNLISAQSRPGQTKLTSFDLLSGSEGLYWWDEKEVLMVVNNGGLYKITDKQGTYEMVPGVVLPTGRRVVFAEAFDFDTAQNYLFLANGGQIAYTDGLTVSYIADVNAPMVVSHIVVVDTYLICNSLTSTESNRWFGSTVSKPFDWTTKKLDYTCQLIPDKILSIQEVDRKVYFIGNQHTEVWYNTGDGGDPFSPVGGVGISSGSVNPYSVVKVQNLLASFNNYRDIGIIEGYNLNVVSVPYAKVLNDLGVTNDCEAEFIASLDGHKYLLFNFTNDKRSIVYDLTINAFYEWSTYDAATGEYGLYSGRCYAYCQKWGYHVIGDRNNSNIYIIDKDNQTDNETPIQSSLTTGVYNWGSSARKKSSALYINLRRGDGFQNDEYSEPSIFVSWADDGKQFGNSVQLGLGAAGSTYPIVCLRPMGVYRTRQYKIILGDRAKLVLSGLEEDVAVQNV